jgi:hypothetical protein
MSIKQTEKNTRNSGSFTTLDHLLIDVDISPLFQLLTAKTTEAHGTLFHKRRHVLFILIFTRHQVLSLKLKNMISKNVGSFRVWATGNKTCTGTICSNSEQTCDKFYHTMSRKE